MTQKNEIQETARMDVLLIVPNSIQNGEVLRLKLYEHLKG